METFEEFKQYLAEALLHLYNPTYHPSQLLLATLGCPPEQGGKVVQTALRRAIEQLKPDPNIPPSARIWRVYKVLELRYEQGLTQEEAANRLGITPRHLRREQQQAIEWLARHLWEQSRPPAPAEVSAAVENPAMPAETALLETATRQAQIRADLASLQQHAPGLVAEVGEVVAGVAPLARVLTGKHGVNLQVGIISPNLTVALHPTLLRQILLTAIEKLVQAMPAGEINLGAEQQGDFARLVVTGSPVNSHLPLSSDFIWESLAVQGGTLEIQSAGEEVTFQIMAPLVRPVNVLVVDDNADLVHFYRRYTAKTRYHIQHLSAGEPLFAAIEAARPDIIILDVMLPDTDGWELLTHLHEYPATRAIPVIVCSVVRREELALALGAALYLPKPVRRQEFIQALEQVLPQPAAAGAIVPARNAPTD
ncbi:MAG: response regulator [Anaerolineae bacterium]